MTSDVGHGYRHAFEGDLSSIDPIIAYDAVEQSTTRRFSHQQKRLNDPDCLEDELNLTTSQQQETQEIAEVEEDLDEETIMHSGEQEDEYMDNTMMLEDAEELDSDDEELTLFKKCEEEQEEIKEEIEDLKSVLPGLERDYKIFDRLGTGDYLDLPEWYPPWPP